MAQHMRMRKAIWDNTNKAAFNYIAYLLASELRALLGDEKPIRKRDVFHLKSNPMNKKFTAIITKRYNSLLVALTNNTYCIMGKINVFHCQRLQFGTPYAGMIK